MRDPSIHSLQSNHNCRAQEEPVLLLDRHGIQTILSQTFIEGGVQGVDVQMSLSLMLHAASAAQPPSTSSCVHRRDPSWAQASWTYSQSRLKMHPFADPCRRHVGRILLALWVSLTAATV